MEIEHTPEKPIVSRPLLEIWIRPRQTIRHIIDHDPAKYFLILVSISGAYRFLDTASDQSLGDDMPLAMILALAAIVGPIAGIISISIGTALVRMTSGWFGGEATTEGIKAVLAWSSVPDIIFLVMYLLIILFFGQEIFLSQGDFVEGPLIIAVLLMGVVIGIPLVIWKAVIFIQCLAEANRFSAWKSIGTTITTFFVIAVPIFLFVWLISQ